MPVCDSISSLTLIGGQARGGLARKGFEYCSNRGKKRKKEKKREKIRNNKFLIGFLDIFFLNELTCTLSHFIFFGQGVRCTFSFLSFRFLRHLFETPYALAQSSHLI